MSTYLNYDIGHCETTASTMQMENERNIPKRLNLDGNHTDVIPSAISLTFDQIKKLSFSKINTTVLDSLGDIRIGKDAVTQPRDGEYFIYFKRSPEEFDKPFGHSQEAKDAKLTCGKLMAVFIYQVVKNSLKFNDDKLLPGSKDELSLLVGCPATKKWTDERNKKAYEQLIRDATGIKKVTVVPESRAAIFSTIGSRNKALSAGKGVMVFDFGSSTADCTYILLGHQIMEYSWDLGASLIEEQLLMSALLEARKKDQTAAPVAQNKMLRDLRMAKEDYFKSGDERDIVCKFRCEDGKILKQEVEISSDTMKEVIARVVSIKADSTACKRGSWKGLCREFMEKGKAYLEDNDLPCNAIVLTGGASHMNFIEEQCKAVFDGNVTAIVRDNNPSYCVATGLSWISLADERRDGCVEDAKNILQSNEKCNYVNLENAIQDSLCDHVFQVVCSISEEWAKAPGDLPVRDLENRIHERMAAPEEQAEIEGIVAKKIGEWVTRFKAGVSEAVNSQSQKIFSQEIAADLLLTDQFWERMDPNTVKVNFDPKTIIECLNVASIVNRVIQQAIYYAVAIAVALALIEIPVVNIIAGVIAGWLAKHLVTDRDKDKLRDQGHREKIADQMPKILKDGETIANFKSSVADAMTSLKDQYNAMLNDNIEAAIDMVLLRRFDEEE